MKIMPNNNSCNATEIESKINELSLSILFFYVLNT
jgi:hypothetical protein